VFLDKLQRAYLEVVFEQRSSDQQKGNANSVQKLGRHEATRQTATLAVFYAQSTAATCLLLLRRSPCRTDWLVVVRVGGGSQAPSILYPAVAAGGVSLKDLLVA
jgi:hypothetical protein